MWANGRCYARSRASFKNSVRTAQRRRGAYEVLRRQAAWNNECPALGAALQSVKWETIRKLMGVSPWGKQLLQRIK
ncbi:hypothetical protein PHMEG_00019166 [Phytophthora megakarya]|uniref:Reverse transcriptase n=1 Tax=Phytophthora megakarya TaxID=4795 RepID=A0A225VUT3_9STRA|nr:hypothetical protein PHMEG_00019166 [Phytophthora megakarya]